MNTLLQEALACYGLQEHTARFIHHNENLTYCVDEQFLLRIHRPAPGIHAASTPEHRRAELAFLAHLHRQGMQVQQPVANRQGDDVSILSDGTAASLLTWLPGEDLSHADPTEADWHAVGRMTARLHQAAQGFSAPHIRQYNGDHCRLAARQLTDMARRHRLCDAQTELFRAACDTVALYFDHSEDSPIAIHDDLSRSNILKTPQGFAPIDFSLFGMGRPMTDLGMLMAGVNPASARRKVLEGYLDEGGVFHQREMEAGFIHGLLGAFVFHADTWPLEPWFGQRLERWNREMLQPFCDDWPIFDEQMNFIYIQ